MYPMLIAGEWVEARHSIRVLDKFGGEEIGHVALAGPSEAEAATAAATRAFTQEQIAPHRRYEILTAAAELVTARKEELVRTMVGETGFTVSEAEADWSRTIQTLEVSAEEAKRVSGEMIPLDGAPGQEHRFGFTIRVPVGPVCAITPFNSPLNTVAHKVAPALAAGCSVVLKPSSLTPLSAFNLCQILTDAGLPAGFLNLVFGSGADVGGALLADQRFRFYAFTGSTEVGRTIQQAIGLRRAQLELGGICATIVCSDAAVDTVLNKVPNAAFRKAGQVCTSLQRLFVHKELFSNVVSGVSERTRHLVVGDPAEGDTEIGPMIADNEAERAEGWVRSAVSRGAKAHTEIRRDGPLLSPVVLTDVSLDMEVMSREIFAPVVSVMPFESLEDAIAMVNATSYGLTAGIFTNDWRNAFRAARDLDVGVVQINESSSSRVDLMPYGGTRSSGYGKEGPRYAIQEMTDERLVVFNR